MNKKIGEKKMFPKLDSTKVNLLAKKLLGKPSGKGLRQESVAVLDVVEIRLLDKNGKQKAYRKIVDALTNLGFAEMAGLITLDVTGQTAFDYIGIGTGTSTPAATQTTLDNESHRVAGTGSRVQTTVANDTAQIVSTFSGFSGQEAITEAGVFNAASAGVMLCRQTFSALNVEAWGRLRKLGRWRLDRNN